MENLKLDDLNFVFFETPDDVLKYCSLARKSHLYIQKFSEQDGLFFNYRTIMEEIEKAMCYCGVICLYKKNPIGIILYRKRDCLAEIFVRPNFRRNGIAKKMIEILRENNDSEIFCYENATKTTKFLCKYVRLTI